MKKNQKNRNILLLCPDEKDATSFYRGWGPFGELAHLDDVPLCLSRASEVSWATIVDKDLVVLQRPFDANHIKILEIARRAPALERDIRTWVDWDDLLWQIPDGNPAKRYYSDAKKIYANVLKCAQLADIVTVSTACLKQCFPDEFQKKIHVLHNRLPRRWRIRTPHQKPNDRIWIAWRGSQSHNADWIDFIDVVKGINQTIDIGWRLIGEPSQWVIERLAADALVEFHKALSVEHFFEWFIQDGPQADILFVPLRDLPFNRAKSHIALLEATFAGMLCVGPKWDEWTTGIPGADALLYTSPQEANACLLRACETARQGAFTLINQLQEHFLAQFQQDYILFQHLVYNNSRKGTQE